MDAQVGATISEHLAAIARSKGTLWDGHASIYGHHRVWLTTLLELDICVPAMHPSVADLQFDLQETHELKWIGKHKEALLSTGKYGTPFSGIEQLWVKANSRGYRDAMLKVWKNEMRSASAELHLAAATLFANCTRGVAEMTLRKNVAGVDRDRLIARLDKRRAAHLTAASGKAQPDLMADFDHTLNGDHVFSASALKNAPDSWVWLFPVPANANQGFGSKVEQRYLKLSSETSARNVSAGMIYKLLASAMPQEAVESKAIVNWIRGQLGSSAQALSRHESIEEFVMDNFTFDKVAKQRHPLESGRITAK